MKKKLILINSIIILILILISLSSQSDVWACSKNNQVFPECSDRPVDQVIASTPVRLEVSRKRPKPLIVQAPDELYGVATESPLSLSLPELNIPDSEILKDSVLTQGSTKTIRRLETRDGQVYAAYSFFPDAPGKGRRLKNELKIYGALRGEPGIVESMGRRISGNQWTHLMRLYSLGDLRACVKGNTASDPSLFLSSANVLSVAKQLCTTISRIHAKKVVHRDLSTDNIFIQSFSPFQVRVGDFDRSYLFEDSFVHSPFFMSQAVNYLFVHPRFFSTPFDFVDLEKQFVFDQKVDYWRVGLIILNLLNHQLEPWQSRGMAFFSVDSPQAQATVDLFRTESMAQLRGARDQDREQLDQLLACALDLSLGRECSFPALCEAFNPLAQVAESVSQIPYELRRVSLRSTQVRKRTILDQTDGKQTEKIETLKGDTYVAHSFNPEEYIRGRRFINEFSLLEKLHSQRVVDSLGVMVQPGWVTQLTRYYQYGDLRQYTGTPSVPEAAKRLHPSDVLRSAKLLCGQMDQIHRTGVVHRDFSPASVWIEGVDPIRIRIGNLSRAYERGDPFLLGAFFQPWAVDQLYAHPTLTQLPFEFEHLEKQFQSDQVMDEWRVGLTIANLAAGKLAPWQRKVTPRVAPLKVDQVLVDQHLAEAMRGLSTLPTAETDRLRQFLECALNLTPTKRCSFSELCTQLNLGDVLSEFPIDSEGVS